VNPFRGSWFRARKRELLLALSTVAVCLVVAEVYLRTVAVDETTCFGYDATLGWDNKLGCVGRFESAEFQTVVRTNGQHMRESETFGLKTDRMRIAVVGDSFVWGHGVGEKDRFTERLQQKLGLEYEVLNFAVGGFGTDQYLLKIKKDILQFEPDLLLVVFFINDLQDIRREANHLGVPKPYYRLGDDGIELTGVPVPKVEGWDRPERGLLRSRLWETVEKALDIAAVVGGASGPDFFNPEHIELLATTNSAELEQSIELNDLIYREMHELARAHNITLVVTEIPYKEYFIPEVTLTERFGLTRSDVRFDSSQQTLQRLSGRLGFLYLNPYSRFRGHGGLGNFYVSDQHLNPQGHVRMAEVVYGGLRESGLLGVR
jgi:lysophospholipase L1-like esterase